MRIVSRTHSNPGSFPEDLNCLREGMGPWAHSSHATARELITSDEFLATQPSVGLHPPGVDTRSRLPQLTGPRDPTSGHNLGSSTPLSGCCHVRASLRAQGPSSKTHGFSSCTLIQEDLETSTQLVPRRVPQASTHPSWQDWGACPLWIPTVACPG